MFYPLTIVALPTSPGSSIEASGEADGVEQLVGAGVSFSLCSQSRRKPRKATRAVDLLTACKMASPRGRGRHRPAT